MSSTIHSTYRNSKRVRSAFKEYQKHGDFHRACRKFILLSYEVETLDELVRTYEGVKDEL